MSTVKTDLPGVVLDCRDHGESDKIITLFCQQVGRLTAIAKGAHRSKKRFVNKLELFSFLQINYSRSKTGGLALIADAELLNSFIELRQSAQRFQAATVIRETMLLATREQLRDDQLFQLLLWALHALDRKMECRNIIALFLVKLFDCIGYQPDLSGCRNCGLAYQGGGSAAISIGAGGLICSNCMKSGEFMGIQLSAGTIKALVSIQEQPLEKIERIKLSGSMLTEMLDLLYKYGRHLFQRDIYSWKQFTHS